MRISDWSSDVCSSDLPDAVHPTRPSPLAPAEIPEAVERPDGDRDRRLAGRKAQEARMRRHVDLAEAGPEAKIGGPIRRSVEKKPFPERPGLLVEIGSAQVRTPVTNATPLCRPLLS